MTGCCAHGVAAGRLFSFFARRYRRRFARRGFERSQQQLLEGLAQAGYAGATVLEIGCGVGHLHQTMLERGASRAVGVDLAPRMLEEAAAWAAERGLAGRTAYLEGDFVELEPALEPADVTVLDKVVCCYPDAEAMLRSTLAKTGRTCALVYPRDRWFVRLGIWLMSAMLWALRSEFRPYLHAPERIRGLLRAGGLARTYERSTAYWLTEVWVRG